MIKLDIKAKTNSGHEHDVVLFKSDAKGRLNGKYIIRIEGTGGSWYMETLVEGSKPYRKQLAIDLGQDWICVNADEIIQAAVMALV